MQRHAPALRALLAGLLAAAGISVAATPPEGRVLSGRVATSPVAYTAGSTMVVEGSRYHAGDVVPAGRAVLDVRSYERELQVAALQDSLLAVRIDLLNARKISDLNALALAGSAAPAYDEKTRRAILKLDVIELLTARQEALERQIDALVRTTSSEGGRFSYPVMLLDHPVRAGQKAAVGAPLFQYLPLDSIEVAVGVPDSGGAPPATLGFRLATETIRLRYLRRLVSPARGAECVYAGEVPARLADALAELYRNPQAQVPVSATDAGTPPRGTVPAVPARAPH